MVVEGEVEQAVGAATFMKYLKNPMKELSGGQEAPYNLNPHCFYGLDQ